MLQRVTQSVSRLRERQLERCGLDFVNKLPQKVSDYNWETPSTFLSPLSSIAPLAPSTCIGSSATAVQPSLLNYIAAPLHFLLSDFDLLRMRKYRLQRMRQQLQAENIAFGIFFDPANIRYVTDCPNMQVWTKSNRYRYVVVSCDERDPLVLFETKGAEHLSHDLEGARIEVMNSKAPIFGSSGKHSVAHASEWANSLIETFSYFYPHIYNEKQRMRHPVRVALDTPPMLAALALAETSAKSGLNIEICDGWQVAELARVIKNEDEIAASRAAVEVANFAAERMRNFIIACNDQNKAFTDNQVFAIMSGTNIELGGEYMECKLLGSGRKSNPWYQESSNHEVPKNTLLSFDTDLIGPFGYCADFSRAFYTGMSSDGSINRINRHMEDETTAVNQKQDLTHLKELYSIAFESIQYNLSLLRPYLSVRELVPNMWDIPEVYYKNRYTCVMHGVGMADEYPFVFDKNEGHKNEYLHDYVFVPGNIVSVESYIGAEDGPVGVKLENQVLFTEDGVELLSKYPFEKDLLLV